MYTLVRCHGRTASGWASVAAGSLTLSALLYNYDACRLYLQQNNEGAIVSVILHDEWKRIEPSQYTQTLDDWLASLEDGWFSLGGTGLTLDKVRKMSRRDLWDYPVTVTLGNAQFGEGEAVPLGLRQDLVISSDDLGVINTLAQDKLFTVNGQLIYPNRIGDRLFLPQIKHLIPPPPGTYLVSVVDFSELGATQYLPLTEMNVEALPQTPDEVMNRTARVVVTTPMDVAQGTVLLNAAGYPHFLDPTVQIYDGHTVILHLNQRQCARRVLQQAPTLWPEGVESINIRNTGISVDHFDVVKYLTQGNSGLLLIQNQDINRHTRLLGRTDLAGTYTFPYKPEGLLLGEEGQILDYHVEGMEAEQASLTVMDNTRHLYMDEYVRNDSRYVVINTERQPPQPEFQEGRMVDLYSTQSI